MYTKVLSDAELAQNRKVDEIRFRGNFANYANLTVANEQPDGLEEDESVSCNVADGSYELIGSVTLTAEEVIVGGKRMFPKCKVEEYDNGEWRIVADGVSSPYTVTAGANHVRITWRWVPSGLTISIQ